MPTPVSAARQCLTEEAARALDDAVAVARRRNHAQTTSLHAISALLALPSSTLREACMRSRSCSSYSPRLQFRALELSVGVSLDRLQTSKTLEDEDPPISNSLMAAIKRSQANQRRHPESFHLLQMHNQQQQTASFLKVELKHFILSILDDPIVSRVFGEAGFRSCNIKIALLQPPLSHAPRFSRNRYSPIFMCNLAGSGSEKDRPGFNFPFMGNAGYEEVDENCRRILDVLVRKTKRNPLLMGVYAKGALKSFIEMIQRAPRVGTLPVEVSGMKVISIEKEISEFFVEGGNEEKMGLKFKDLGRAVVEQCSGSGIAVNFGGLEVFVEDCVSASAVRFVVSQLTSLLEIHGGKIWLMGVAGTSDIYSKFLALFPTVEKDWDLHLLTMTSSASHSIEGLYPKSSLMGSFVPFGGFFAAPSEFKKPVSSTSQSSARCPACNEKYEQEVSDILKMGHTTSGSSNSTGLPWLQQANMDTCRPLDAKINEDFTSSNPTIMGLQRKWDDICQRLHQARPLPEFSLSHTRPQAPSLESSQRGLSFKESCSKDQSPNPIQYSGHSPYMPKELHGIYSSKQILRVSVPSDTVSLDTGTDQGAIVSKSQQTEMQNPLVAHFPVANASSVDQRSSSSLTSVTTDLGLGTIYTSGTHEPKTPKVQDHREGLHHLSDSISTDFDGKNENTFHQVVQSSSCFGPSLGGKLDSIDFKLFNRLLNERVGWQEEAICSINQTLSLCRSGARKLSGSHPRADIWLAFYGPDRVGKKKIASTLAEIINGNTESLISVDFSSQDMNYPLNSICEYQKQKSFCYNVLRRKTVVDYIAGELSKQPHSVVFLEDVDKVDFLVQNSLLQAIRTGKFPDSHGREISINNAVFIVTSTVSKCEADSFLSVKEPTFSEERVLEAKRCQMQLLLGQFPDDATRSIGANVWVTPRKSTTKLTSPNKRKLVERFSESIEQATTSSKLQKPVQEASRSYLDLNMPLQEVEDDWLDDFYGQINAKVAFKPFDFDTLAEKILKSISIQLQRTFGSRRFKLEIDYEVMVQILAAAWLSDKKNAVEDWVENVLGRSFNEALHKYHPEAHDFMKLVSCEGIFMEEQASGACLPAKINLN